MKKSTLVRSDKPHAVKMAEGTNVAQRKNVKKTSAPEAPSPAPDNIQKIAPVTAAATEPATVPAKLLKPVRAKPKLSSAQTPSPTARPKPTPKVAAKSTPKVAPKAATQPKAPAKPAAKARPPAAPRPAPPPEPVWEQDNPIKNRIEQLKARNAQLAEQLQRLQSAPTARGQRP